MVDVKFRSPLHNALGVELVACKARLLIMLRKKDVRSCSRVSLLHLAAAFLLMLIFGGASARWGYLQCNCSAVTPVPPALLIQSLTHRLDIRARAQGCMPQCTWLEIIGLWLTLLTISRDDLHPDLLTRLLVLCWWGLEACLPCSLGLAHPNLHSCMKQPALAIRETNISYMVLHQLIFKWIVLWLRSCI